jgi:hypothetical protein
MKGYIAKKGTVGMPSSTRDSGGRQRSRRPQRRGPLAPLRRTSPAGGFPGTRVVLATTTYNGYCRNVENHIVPTLGHIG